MRPKVVILTVIAAFVVLGLVALLKGLAGKNVGSGSEQGVAVQTSADAHSASTNDQSTLVLNASNSVIVSEQLRNAVIEKEIEQIQDLQGQADGTNNPMIITALIDKLANPEAEVRQAALDALKQLNDTNAVPGLEKAAENISDPREKVTVLDTIDYLKLPSVTQNVSSESPTNYAFHADRRSVSTNIQFNPNFLKGNKRNRAKNEGQQLPQPNAPVGQSQ